MKDSPNDDNSDGGFGVLYASPIEDNSNLAFVFTATPSPLYVYLSHIAAFSFLALYHEDT